MFKILFCLVLFIRAMVCSAQWSDDFSDGNFSAAPAWSGDMEKFIVSQGRLQLNAAKTDKSAYLSLPSSLAHGAVWQFDVWLEFKPSSSNYTFIYLVSDRAELTQPLQGYFVKLGGVNREVSLFRQDGSKITRIIQGQTNRLNQNRISIRIKTTCTSDGVWSLFSDVTMQDNFVMEGKATDTIYPTGSYFGIACFFTPTRSTKFSFDNFKVDLFHNQQNYPTGLKGKRRAIIINEIFPGPFADSPLPHCQYIELYNPSQSDVDITGWQIMTSYPSNIFPATTIKAGEYRVVVSAGYETVFNGFGRVMALNTFPAFNMTGDPIIVKDGFGQLIDSINFDPTWYKDSSGQSEGISLELIDPGNNCSEEGNWAASEDLQGGTPGQKNSIMTDKADLIGPQLIRAFPADPYSVVLQFNKKLDSIISIDQFKIIPERIVDAATFTDVSLREIKIHFSNPLLSQEYYSVSADVYDCNGNSMNPEFRILPLKLPEAPTPGDLLINEVLFYPLPGGEEFIEFYNVSSKFISIQNWTLAKIDSGNLKSEKKFSLGRILTPGEYLLLTKNPASVYLQYPQSVKLNFLQTIIPHLPQKKGSISISDDHLQLIDSLYYSDKMHSLLLNNHQGVSLERISLKGKSNDPSNWNSANAITGYATPGYLNSNSPGLKAGDDSVWVEPSLFSSHSFNFNAGHINFHFDETGMSANVWIMDEKGRIVKKIANNETIGLDGFFIWRGEREDGLEANPGYYVVWFEVFNTNGKVTVFRKRIILSH